MAKKKDLNPNTAKVTADDKRIDRLIAAFTPERLQSLPRAQHDSKTPVFILGMPRSGTSLVEQILASHPQVHGAGELNNIMRLESGMPDLVGGGKRFPDGLNKLTQEHVDELASHYLEHLAELSPDALRVTDKMPNNFLHLGTIQLLFPDARIIHCMRDPLDTCLSCYFQNFFAQHPYTNDLGHLGAYYNGYERLMAHWKQTLDLPIFDIRYEDLVENQETKSREMIEFIGLEWDEACLKFHENKRIGRTASYDQVRQPIYKGSVARWRNYESHLEPLRKALEAK